MVIDIKQPTPEELEAHRQQEIAERKAEVEAEKQRRNAERKQKEQNQALAYKASQEAAVKRREAEWAELTYGMDKYQIEDLKRLLELVPMIQRTSLGNGREDLQAEYDIILKRFLAKGRYMGTMSFIPVTIYVSTNGQGLLIPRGNGDFDYREGTIGAFSTTDRMAERDPKTNELKITAPSMIPKSNLSISNKWTVILKDNKPEQAKQKKERFFR